MSLLFLVLGISATIFVFAIGYCSGKAAVEHEAIMRGLGHYSYVTRKFFWKGDSGSEGA